MRKLEVILRSLERVIQAPAAQIWIVTVGAGALLLELTTTGYPFNVHLLLFTLILVSALLTLPRVWQGCLLLFRYVQLFWKPLMGIIPTTLVVIVFSQF